MPMDKFLIGYIDENTGLQTDLRPYAIPDNAFAELNNAYIYRGRVRKRFGALPLNTTVPNEIAQFYTRLRVNIGTTDGAGAFSGNVRTITTHATLPIGIGQAFSVVGTASDDEMFTVDTLGTPAAMVASGTGAGTFNTTNSDFTITGSFANADVYFYPALPVMGFTSYEVPPITNEPVFAYDQAFAYQFVNGGWERLGLASWTGSDADFFWGITWRGASTADNLLFVTNYTAADGIKYWDGTAWTNFTVTFNPTGPLQVLTARIVVAFKNRLLLMNTIETGPVSFTNRVRFSQNGSPLATDAFYESNVTPGRGGFIDCPTKEAIISCEFVKDRLIVFCERSTWELVYTGNEILPFVWQKLNTELGVESTFSVVPFDRVALGIGDVGIHACNGSNVERVDNKIPNIVFDIQNDNQGVFRVCGIRDYKVELVYWTFPAIDNDYKFPQRILVYNYKTNSWAINDDSITFFGYFQNPNDITWSGVTDQWQGDEDPWNSGTQQAQFRQVIAGNQEGFTFIVDPDVSENSLSLQITSIAVNGTFPNWLDLTIINHNLKQGDVIRITGIVNAPILAPIINDQSFIVQAAPSVNVISIDINTAITPDYVGKGVVIRLSRVSLLTKQFNFYAAQGRNCYIERVDFMVDKTFSFGDYTVDYYTSSSNFSSLFGASISGALLGNSVLTTYPANDLQYNGEHFQERLWRSVFLQDQGEWVQLKIHMSDEQMLGPTPFVPFQLHQMVFYAQPTSYGFLP